MRGTHLSTLYITLGIVMMSKLVQMKDYITISTNMYGHRKD